MFFLLLENDKQSKWDYCQIISHTQSNTSQFVQLWKNFGYSSVCVFYIKLFSFKFLLTEYMNKIFCMNLTFVP